MSVSCHIVEDPEKLDAVRFASPEFLCIGRSAMSSCRTPISGLLFALFALVTQLALGAVVPQPERALTRMEAGIICHASGSTDETPAPADHHPLDCLLCPLCISLTAASVLLPAMGPHLPSPQVKEFQPPGLPPSTAPPVLWLAAAQPRGPPSLI
jgi:hypothetical protein